ncbi:MAG: tryptophan synthase subunit alpha [Gammaproteobacteria bacterium]|nr:MAG: tryptophan synthase subunit alpha [Gammaproteobacteria bacterium]
MSRIKACFADLKSANKTALIPFVTAGDPHPDHTVDIMHVLADAGCDIIELGVPFSDPMADGPTIQLADERALAHGTTIHDVIAMVKTFREKNTTTPVVLMGYLNPIEVVGYQAFAKAASEAGVDGVLTVDMPPEASAELNTALAEVDMEPIFLIAPTTTEARIKTISDAAKGYLYYVSVKGITGAGNLDTVDVARKLETIRKITDLPIAVGFGIKDPETAGQVAALADGVVVGSALVNVVAENQHDPQAILNKLTELAVALRQGIDSKIS